MDSNTVLVIEDNDDDAFLLTQSFKKAGLSNPILVFSEAEPALDLLKKDVETASKEQPATLPLCVLLDLKLPGMSGFDFLESVRVMKALDRLLIIVLSASNVESDIALAYDLGARSYLVKPAKPADLVTLVNNATLARTAGTKEYKFPGIARPKTY